MILYPNEKNLSPSEVLKTELNYENWKAVYKQYSREFESQKRHILYRMNSNSEQREGYRSVLQKLEKNKKVIAESQVHSAQLHKKRTEKNNIRE